MVVVHNIILIVRISRLTLLCLILMLFSMRILFSVFAASSVCQISSFLRVFLDEEFLKINMLAQTNPSLFVKMHD